MISFNAAAMQINKAEPKRIEEQMIPYQTFRKMKQKTLQTKINLLEQEALLRLEQSMGMLPILKQQTNIAVSELKMKHSRLVAKLEL